MLMYGLDTPEVISIKFTGKGVVFSLNSLREGFLRLPSLIPPNALGRFIDRDFDIAYMQYILLNDSVFVEFFQIIYNLYIGNDVFILYNNEDWSENIMESLLKLIQQRYGYNAIMISSDEDYVYARNNTNNNFAPGYGIYNLDQDKERFTYLIESFRLAHNGAIPANLCIDGFFVGNNV